MSAPASIRAFIAGASGTGKSTIAWRLYLSRFPRRLLLDQTGEWSDPARYPAGYTGPDAVVWSVSELSRVLRDLAARGRWTVVAELGLDVMPALVGYLIPVPDIAASPIYQCHGAAMLVDEVDLVAPPRSLRQEIRTLYRRSRHAGLSLISTTQRPEAVSREVSAQSTQVICLSLVEPDAWDYMASLMGRDLAGMVAWTRRHPHGGLWLDKITGRAMWLTESGRLVRPAPTELGPTRPARTPPPGDDADAGVAEQAGPG